MQCRAVHHRKTAGFSGQPDMAGGILEYPVHEDRRDVAAQDFAPLLFQGVRLRVQDIDALRGCCHPQFGRPGSGPEFEDVGYVRRGIRVSQVHTAEGTVVRIEDLQAQGCAHPQDAAAVLEDRRNEVAGEDVRLAAGEPEGREVHAVEPGEAVLRADPDEPAGILVNFMDLAAGKAGVGRVEPGHLAAGRYQKCKKQQDSREKMFHNQYKYSKIWQNLYFCR